MGRWWVQALDSFSVQLNGYPRPGSAEDHDMVVNLAQGFNREIVTEDGRVINKPLVDEVTLALCKTNAEYQAPTLAHLFACPSGP